MLTTNKKNLHLKPDYLCRDVMKSYTLRLKKLQNISLSSKFISKDENLIKSILE